MNFVHQQMQSYLSAKDLSVLSSVSREAYKKHEVYLESNYSLQAYLDLVNSDEITYGSIRAIMRTDAWRSGHKKWQWIFYMVCMRLSSYEFTLRIRLDKDNGFSMNDRWAVWFSKMPLFSSSRVRLQETGLKLPGQRKRRVDVDVEDEDYKVPKGSIVTVESDKVQYQIEFFDDETYVLRSIDGHQQYYVPVKYKRTGEPDFSIDSYTDMDFQYGNTHFHAQGGYFFLTRMASLDSGDSSFRNFRRLCKELCAYPKFVKKLELSLVEYVEPFWSHSVNLDLLGDTINKLSDSKRELVQRLERTGEKRFVMCLCTRTFPANGPPGGKLRPELTIYVQLVGMGAYKVLTSDYSTRSIHVGFGMLDGSDRELYLLQPRSNPVLLSVGRNYERNLRITTRAVTEERLQDYDLLDFHLVDLIMKF